jgi:hypothetical protein
MTSPEIFFPEFPLAWEMSTAEQFILNGMLSRLRPEVAIEIGTHFGGSLQVLDAFCGQVHSIDSDPAVQAKLAPRFPRVHFHTGVSRVMIPAVLAEIQRAGRNLEFILLDGDHSAKGVQADIKALLLHRPRSTLHIVMHDSFNPDCRRGMRMIPWNDFPHVHAVDLDLVTGNFHATAQGGAFARSMWGGVGLVVLKPEPRSGSIAVNSPGEALHQIVFRQSAHHIWNKVARRIRRSLAR